MVVLFFMKVKKMSEIKMDRLKEYCKKRNIKVGKNSTRDELCVQLGTLLYGKSVDRINKEDQI